MSGPHCAITKQLPGPRAGCRTGNGGKLSSTLCVTRDDVSQIIRAGVTSLRHLPQNRMGDFSVPCPVARWPVKACFPDGQVYGVWVADHWWSRVGAAVGGGGSSS